MRFGIKTLLILVAWAALGIFWSQWPHYTASRFVSLCSQPGTLREATQLTNPRGDDLQGFDQMLKDSGGKFKLISKRRDPLDWLAGRCEFLVETPKGRCRFSVRRGRVENGPRISHVYGGQEFMLDVF